MVIISLGLSLLAASCSLPGRQTERAIPYSVTSLKGQSKNSVLLGLAPDGVCPASDITATAGGLLHHRFTLTDRRVPPDRQYASLLHLPSGFPARLLAGIVLYGVRTFLSLDQAKPRSPSQLGKLIVTLNGRDWQVEFRI